MLPSALLPLLAILAQTKISSCASSPSSSSSSSSLSSLSSESSNSNNNKKPFRTITIHFDKDAQTCTNVCLSICNDGDKMTSNDITPENLRASSPLVSNASKAPTQEPPEEENEFELISNTNRNVNNKMSKNFRIASGEIREVEGDMDDRITLTSSEERPGPPILERLILQDDRVGEAAVAMTTEAAANSTLDPVTTTVAAGNDSSEVTTSSSAETMTTPDDASPPAAGSANETMTTTEAANNTSVTTMAPDMDGSNATTTVASANMTMTTISSNDTTMTTTMSSNGAAFRTDTNATANSTQTRDEDGFDDDSQNETKPFTSPVEQQRPVSSGVKGRGGGGGGAPSPAPTSPQSSENPDIDIVRPIINAGVKGLSGGTKGGGLAGSSSNKSGKKFRSPSAAARQRLNRVKKEDRSDAAVAPSPSNGYRRRRKSHREGNRRRNRNSSRVRVSNKKRKGSGSSRRRGSSNGQSSSEVPQGDSSRRYTWGMEPLPAVHDPGFADVPFRASTLSRRYARPPLRYHTSYSISHTQG